MFLASVGGNVFHVFPHVYRAEGTECSPWLRKLACWGLAAGVWPGQHIHIGARADAGRGRLRAAGEGRVGEQRPRSSGHASRRRGSQGLGELCGQGIRGCPLTRGTGGGFPGPVPLELGPPAEQHEASLPQQRFCCRAGQGSGSRATQGSGAGLTPWPGRPGRGGLVAAAALPGPAAPSGWPPGDRAGAQAGGRAPWLSSVTGRAGRPRSTAPKGAVCVEGNPGRQTDSPEARWGVQGPTSDRGHPPPRGLLGTWVTTTHSGWTSFHSAMNTLRIMRK